MNNLDAMMSSARPDWNTPECVLSLVREVFDGEIGLDPCSNSRSIVDATFAWSKETGGNGLLSPWGEYETVYVNPPYGREIAPWISKCSREHDSSPHTQIIALVPARVDTAWFQTCWDATALCFWRGRIRFLGAPSSAPFPSAVIYWGRRPERFEEIFERVGYVVAP